MDIFEIYKYAKELDVDNEMKLQNFAALIREMQREQQIQTAQNQVVFLLRQEMSMKEGMAKLIALNKPVNPDFRIKLSEVIQERDSAEKTLKQLMEKRP